MEIATLSMPGAVLARGAGSSGFLELKPGAKAELNGSLTVGQRGTGTLLIESGVNMFAEGRNPVIAGTEAGSQGNITVQGHLSDGLDPSGPGNSLVIGQRGTGELTVASGGSVFFSNLLVGQSDSDNRVLVNGPSHLLNAVELRISTLAVIGDGGRGRLDVMGGATATANHLIVGRNSNADSHVTIEAESVLNTTEQFVIGQNGTGTVTCQGIFGFDGELLVGVSNNAQGRLDVTGSAARARE